MLQLYQVCDYDPSCGPKCYICMLTKVLFEIDRLVGATDALYLKNKKQTLYKNHENLKRTFFIFRCGFRLLIINSDFFFLLLFWNQVCNHSNSLSLFKTWPNSRTYFLSGTEHFLKWYQLIAMILILKFY